MGCEKNQNPKSSEILACMTGLWHGNDIIKASKTLRENRYSRWVGVDDTFVLPYLQLVCLLDSQMEERSSRQLVNKSASQEGDWTEIERSEGFRFWVCFALNSYPRETLWINKLRKIKIEPCVIKI